MIGCSPFKIIYNYKPQVLISIKDNIIKEKIPAIKKKVKKLYKLYKELVK